MGRSVHIAKQAEVKARITGVATRMKIFDSFFDLMLSERILKHADNLSKTMQATEMSAVEEHHITQISVSSMRTNESFDVLGTSTCQSADSRLKIWFFQEHISAPGNMMSVQINHMFIVTQNSTIRQVYYQSLDLSIVTIEERFNQGDYQMYATLKQLLLAEAKRDYSEGSSRIL